MARTLSRTLVADFDSVQQAELVQRVGRTEAWWRMRAQLRTAHLLAEEIVLTDAQLLDGIYLLALGPAGIGEVLGLSTDTPLPFVVVARGGDLGGALAQMRSTPAFTWSSALAADVLAEDGSFEVDLDAAREAWVDAARRGIVRVEPFPAGGFPIADTLRERPPPTDELPAPLLAELRTLTHRSTARDVIAAAELAPPTAEAARQWWEEAYAAALARQHGATWLMFGRQDNQRVSETPIDERPGLARRVAAAVSRTRRRRRIAQLTTAEALELDGTMLTTMATIPPGLYATIVYRTREVRARWMERRDGGSLLSLALAVRLHTSPAESWLARYRGTAVRTAVLCAAMVLTLLSAVIPALSGWLVVPILAALLGEVPYAELRALVDERPGRLRGVIHLPAAKSAR